MQFFGRTQVPLELETAANSEEVVRDRDSGDCDFPVHRGHYFN